MAGKHFPEFRLGKVLATSFTATLTERCGEPVERVPVPERLVDWLAVNGLVVDSCSESQLELARQLREAIHEAATSVATEVPLPAAAVQVINDCSTGGHASSILSAQGRHEWHLSSASVEDALSVIAADAVDIVSGARDGKMALCASPTCQAAFFDTSRGATRRWCEMNTCGNREKKARFLANKRQGPSRAG